MLKTQKITLSAIFIALFAISGAFLNIKLPGNMPAFSLQLFVVLIAACILGSRYGTAATAVYALMGLCGLPVFTNGGGIHYILMPSFGYIIGFIPCAFCVGALMKKIRGKMVVLSFLVCVVGVLIDYLFGSVYMYFILNFYMQKQISVSSVLQVSVNIYIIKDIILCIPAPVIAVRYGRLT